MKKHICIVMLLAAITGAMVISGCGETVNGLGKDTKRMGKGVKTFFFRDAN